MFTKQDEIAVEGLVREDKPDLARPSVEALSYILKHINELMPAWDWSYHSCETCAMGVVKARWGGQATSYDVRERLGLSINDVTSIFCNAGGYHNAFRDLVPISAADVAAKLDEWLGQK